MRGLNTFHSSLLKRGFPRRLLRSLLLSGVNGYLVGAPVQIVQLLLRHLSLGELDAGQLGKECLALLAGGVQLVDVPGTDLFTCDELLYDSRFLLGRLQLHPLLGKQSRGGVQNIDVGVLRLRDLGLCLGLLNLLRGGRRYLVFIIPPDDSPVNSVIPEGGSFSVEGFLCSFPRLRREHTVFTHRVICGVNCLGVGLVIPKSNSALHALHHAAGDEAAQASQCNLTDCIQIGFLLGLSRTQVAALLGLVEGNGALEVGVLTTDKSVGKHIRQLRADLFTGLYAALLQCRFRPGLEVCHIFR